MKKDLVSFIEMMLESIIMHYRHSHPNPELEMDQITYDELSDMLKDIRDMVDEKYPHMSEKIRIYADSPVIKDSITKWILHEIEESGVDIEPSIKNIAFLMDIFEFGLHNGAVPIIGFNTYLNMTDEDIEDMIDEFNNNMNSSYNCKECKENKGKVIPLFPDKE